MDDYIQMSPELVDARRRGDLECVLQLVDAGEDLRAVDYHEGWTLLHWAAHCGHTDLARALLGRGADLECLDEESQTPLMLAAFAGHLDMVRLLLERGANPAAETHGRYAEDFARMKDHTAIQLVLAMARRRLEPDNAVAKGAQARWERIQARDREVALEIFLARPENRESEDPLVGVWQDIGKAMVHHADGSVATVSMGGRNPSGPLTRWRATPDGEFIYDSTPLGAGGKVTHSRWRLNADGSKLFLTNEFGTTAEFDRRSPWIQA